jgi:hypothetical protein
MVKQLKKNKFPEFTHLRKTRKKSNKTNRILSHKKTQKQCPDGKVLNPNTNRCIGKSGALAKKIGLQ